MIEISIPGREQPYRINAVTLDYNGTIACDGVLIPGAAERIKALAQMADVYVLTADTYGTVQQQCAGLGAVVRPFDREGAAKCKEEIVRGLGTGVCAIGNGFNDIQMFDAAELSIAIIHAEGASAQLLQHATVVCLSPNDAMDLLLKPNRLKATLRN